MNPQATAEELLGTIDWQNDTTGYCACPGVQHHTGPDSFRDCQVFLEGAPTIHCFHDSCANEVAHANLALRRALGTGKGTLEKLPRTKRTAKRVQQANVSNAQAMLGRIMEQGWHPADMWEDSPCRLLDDCTHDWRRLLQLFGETDVIWIGDIKDSGLPAHARNFRTKREWDREEHCPAQFTCPATFKPDSYSRSKSNVLTRPYLVVESDTLKKEEIGAVFRWLNKYLPLYAVVDTGSGRSIHGWFAMPPAKSVPLLKQTLMELGCDGKMFTESQPCRLPSAKRGKVYQSLLFFAPDGFQHT